MLALQQDKVSPVLAKLFESAVDLRHLKLAEHVDPLITIHSADKFGVWVADLGNDTDAEAKNSSQENFEVSDHDALTTILLLSVFVMDGLGSNGWL